ncbi:SOS response-associated peptidase (plasmid) [Deinococcus taeanensis]|uniref:SOS response-associated peptidase n=1 Tax=Deinococcus taeanensis TaxID=2737050 RepID=UPI001CDC24C2|nr:SOS response-associated peptidase [Deinococcus taeanensis]UBV45501.1 SOS response-associated peptidase [Deinococcus taeanensis]
MCGRIEFTLSERMHQTLRDTFQIDAASPDQPEIKPTQAAPFLTLDEAWTVRSGRWGLIPPGLDLQAAKKYATFNARIETIERSKVFKDAFKAGGRCVVPLSAFFEWPNKSKVRIARPDDRPLLALGLWGQRDTPDGPLLSCTIITRPPTEDLAEVHDRMPALLLTRDLDAWLRGSTSDAKAVTTGSWRPGLLTVTPAN